MLFSMKWCIWCTLITIRIFMSSWQYTCPIGKKEKNSLIMNLCWEFNFYPLKKGEKLLWFSLGLYNQVLLTFDYDNLPLSGEECRILWVDEDNKKLLPIGLKLTERGIISWLKSRVVHKKRANAEILLTKLGLSFNDILGIIRASQGLSLNDSYWVVEDVNPLATLLPCPV